MSIKNDTTEQLTNQAAIELALRPSLSSLPSQEYRGECCKTPPMKLANEESVLQFFLPNTANEQLLETYINLMATSILGDRQGQLNAKPNKTQRPPATALPARPLPLPSFLEKLKKTVVQDATRVSSKQMVGHMTSALPYFQRPLAKLLTTLNQNVVKMETASTMTFLERDTLMQLHMAFYNSFSQEEYANMRYDPDAVFGMFCSGGTVANISALWMARNRAFKPFNDQRGSFEGIAKSGLHRALQAYGYSDVVVVGSEMMHYSFKKAVDLLGLGEKGLVKIPTDASFRVRIDLLEERVKALKAANVCVLAIVGVAGTTESGSIDNLAEIARISRQHNIHFHVDGAWGGPIIFSSEHGKKLGGIEQADTITVDGHKQLYTPMGLGVVLTRNPKSIDSIKKEANYIIRKGSLDMGKFTLEGSRPANVLYLHASLHLLGRDGFDTIMSRLISLTHQLWTRMLLHPSRAFQPLHEPDSNIMLYRVVPRDLRNNFDALDAHQEQMDAMQVAVHSKLTRTFVSRTKAFFNGQHVVALRIVIGNPLTEWADLQQTLNEQLCVCSEVDGAEEH